MWCGEYKKQTNPKTQGKRVLPQCNLDRMRALVQFSQEDEFCPLEFSAISLENELALRTGLKKKFVNQNC